jgi:hypothetical protein
MGMRHVATRRARKACSRMRSRGASRRAHVHDRADQWTRHGRAPEAEPAPRPAEISGLAEAGVGQAKRPKNAPRKLGASACRHRVVGLAEEEAGVSRFPPCPAIRRQATSQCSSHAREQARVISFAALSLCHRSGREPTRLDTLAARPKRARVEAASRRSLLERSSGIASGARRVPRRSGSSNSIASGASIPAADRWFVGRRQRARWAFQRPGTPSSRPV